MALNDNRIIDIEGVSFLVDDATYDYYWSTRDISETSESHIIACRRILQLGPNDTQLDYYKIFQKMRADLKDHKHLFSILEKSELVSYIEPDYLRGKSEHISGAAKSLQAEQAINKIDPEFEDDLDLEL